MSDPRCFIIRHGETEWSLNGRHTGTTDLPLTANGEKRVRATGKALVGEDRLIAPSKVAHIFVSPRKRAQHTLELLDLGCHDRFPWADADHDKHGPEDLQSKAKIEITEAIREWDYGDYEGLTSKQIHEDREKRGEKKWDIWQDGCPGGEYVDSSPGFNIGPYVEICRRSPADVTERLDALIAEIRSKYHAKAMGDKQAQGDVLVVAHGHILRAFAMRWIGRELTQGVNLILEAGGIGTLSYEHHKLDEPAIILGGAFVVS